MSKWFANYRQEWIGNFIDDNYYINRQVLMEKFDIGGAQATRDITLFRKRNPELKLEYETSFKKYITINYYTTIALQKYAAHNSNKR